MRRLVLLAVAILVGCGGASDGGGGEKRSFEVEHVLLRDGGIVLVGKGLAGRVDQSCGTRRELVTVELAPNGRRTGVTDFPQEELGDCVASIDDAFLDGDGVVVSGWLELESSEGGADAAPYGARLAFGKGPDPSFGDAGSLALQYPTSGLAPLGRDLLYAGGILFARNGQPVDQRAFPYGGRPGRVVAGSRDRAFVVLHREAFASYDAFTVARGRRGGVTNVRFATDVQYDEVTDLEPSPLGWLVFVTHAVDDYTYLVYRHLPDGRLDRGFGRDGRIAMREASLETVTDIAPTPDGGLAAAGQLDRGQRRKAFVVRYDGSGRRVGLLLVDLGPRTDDLFSDARAAVAVDPRGDVVLAASIAGRPTKIFRFDRDGRAEKSFGEAGIATLPSL